MSFEAQLGGGMKLPKPPSGYATEVVFRYFLTTKFSQHFHSSHLFSFLLIFIYRFHCILLTAALMSTA